jgi:hypothetical protein
MYTIEVNGKPIAVANVGSHAEAEEMFNSDWFKEEMMVFETEDGNDLWNGSDPFLIRPARPEEVAKFKPIYAAALQSGNTTEGEPYLVFLIPVTDATDELD